MGRLVEKKTYTYKVTDSISGDELITDCVNPQEAFIEWVRVYFNPEDINCNNDEFCFEINIERFNR